MQTKSWKVMCSKMDCTWLPPVIQYDHHEMNNGCKALKNTLDQKFMHKIKIKKKELLKPENVTQELHI